MSKIFTVFGATGQQGGSVVASVLKHPELSKAYKVRAVTRDTTKPSALRLKEQGAEVVKADMNDIESLKAAMQGAHVVFGVTNFWEGGGDADRELRQGAAMANAAVAAGVELLIFSTLPHVTRVTEGKLPHVSHFDMKARIEEHIRTLPIRSAFFWPAFFMPNFLPNGATPIAANDDGTYSLRQIWNPDSKVPVFDPADDTGKFIGAILLDQARWTQPPRSNDIKNRIYGATAFYTPTELVQTFTRVTGKKATYEQISEDAFRAQMPEKLAEELLENMILIRDFKYFGPEGQGPEAGLEVSVQAASKVDALTTFEQYVKKSKW